MSGLKTWLTARKPHTCTFCQEAIPVGQRYVRHSLPPHDYEIQNTGWWHLAAHGETSEACEAYWRVDPSQDGAFR